MELIIENLLMVLLAVLLVLINGFFVAAEFALVKVRPSRIDSYVVQKRGFAKIVRAQLQRLEAALAACQLGITLSSLGLGWIGEPALAKLIRPLFDMAGIQSEILVHGVSFAIAFSIITALHLTIGEQVPKIYAVKNPERVALWCALPLKVFYHISYPFLILLNATSNYLLKLIGVNDANEHDGSHSEEEIRGLMAQAHSLGELTRTEHRLLNAVFEFDDRIVSEVMVPKRDIVILEEGKTLDEYLAIISSSKHTRYPFCQNSLDNVFGVVHIKDLVEHIPNKDFDIRTILRPPIKIPEGMALSRLLRHFQSSKQHMAFVVDEFGNVIGVVTLENVLEEIVGAMQDEFDRENPRVVPEEKNTFLVDGGISLKELSNTLKVDLLVADAQTLSGMITEKLGTIPREGDSVNLGDIQADVIHAQDGCAEKVRVRILRVEE